MSFETFLKKIHSPWAYLIELFLTGNFLVCSGGLLIKYNHYYFDQEGIKGLLFYLGNFVFLMFLGFFISSSVQMGISCLKMQAENET